MKKFFKILASVLFGVLTYAIVSSLIIFLICLLLYVISKIKLLSFIFSIIVLPPKYLDDGFMAYRFSMWYIYAPACIAAHISLSWLIGKIAGYDDTESISLKIVGIILLLVFTLSIIVNIIGLFNHSSELNSVLTNLVFIISSVSIIKEANG